MEDASIKIPPELFALAESSCFEGALDFGLLSVGPDDYRFESPLDWRVEVTNTGSALLVSGIAAGKATVACARCLADVVCEFAGDIEGFFLIGSADGRDFDDDDEDGPGLEEFDVLPDDHIIDLKPLIKSALMVDAPSVPLCSQECKGLCPRCGANLNEGLCTCPPDERSESFEEAMNPFSVLKGLKFDE